MTGQNPTETRIERFRWNLIQLWRGLQNPEADQDADHVHQRMILHEAGRAVKAWIVMYAFFFFLLLGYKWQAKGYYQAEYERKLASMQVPVETTVAPWWTFQEAVVNEALSGVRDFGKLQDSELKKSMQYQTILQGMKETLHHLEFKFGSVTNEAANHGLSSGSLVKLLNQPRLAEFPSIASLNQSLQQSLAEVKGMLHDPEKTNWTLVQSQLSGRFPQKLPSVLDDAVARKCSASLEEETSIQVSPVPSNAARQSDLEEPMRVMKTYLERRSKAHQEISGLLMPDTLSSVERATQQRIHVTLEMIIAGIMSGTKQAHASTSSSCLTRDDILEIVEEGLLALEQGANLRNVMRKKIVELDPSATSIILDADLPPPIPKIPRRETTNLRRVLETPLLIQLAQTIDHLVEMVGGHNEKWDQWLDSIVLEHESVGAMVVRRILEESGKVEIPNLEAAVKQYLPPNAQAYMKKYIHLT